MQIERTQRFRRAYRSLTENERKQVKKAISLLTDNWRHPSLAVKRVRGTDGIWEARAGLSLRITFELEDDTIVLRNVGSHNDTLKAA